jgi:hypothetical protein
LTGEWLNFATQIAVLANTALIVWHASRSRTRDRVLSKQVADLHAVTAGHAVKCEQALSDIRASIAKAPA